MGGKTTSETKVDPKVQALQLGNYAKADELASTPVVPYSGSLDLSGSRAKVEGLMNYQAPTVAASQIDRAKIADVSTQKLPDIDLSGYLNPFLNEVVDNTSADIERARLIQRSADSASANANGAWNGSRHGVADAQTNEAALRTVASKTGELRMAGFTQAQQAAQTDMARKLQADLANQGVSVTVEQANAMLTQQAAIANQNASIQSAGVQANAAGLMGNMTKAEYDAAYQEWLRQQNDPLVKQQLRNQALGGVAAPTSTTQKTTPGLFDYAQAGAGAAAAYFGAGGSDRRIKTDIEFLRSDHRGRRWYAYRYVWDEPDVRREGVMAQEIMETDPQAVHTHPMGFLMVDYGALQ